MARTLFIRSTAAAALATLAWASSSAIAAPDKLREAEAQYRLDRAACLDGSREQDRQACLREAGAVLAEARSGKFESSESSAVLMRNATARCAAVLDQDRTACERMARGEGEQSGSVGAGGVLKQIVTRTVETTPTRAVPTPTPAPTR